MSLLFSSLESNPSIFVGVDSSENVLDVFFTDEDWQRSHDKAEIFLGEKPLIQFIFLL